mgnify:CR=1 FL=1
MGIVRFWGVASTDCHEGAATDDEQENMGSGLALTHPIKMQERSPQAVMSIPLNHELITG